MTKRGRPFDDVVINQFIEDPQLAVELLNDCLADGDIEGFLLNLGRATKAFGLQQVAHENGLHEKSLYKTFSSSGNPSLKTLLGITKTLGLQIQVAHKKY